MYLEKAIRIRDAIEADKNNEKYFEQYKVEHKHTTGVKAVAYSANSKYLVSSAIDGSNVFSILKDSAQLKETLPGDESSEDGQQVLNCVSNDGKLVGVYRGNMSLTVYSGIQVKETRNLSDQCNFKKGDKVTELKFI